MSDIVHGEDCKVEILIDDVYFEIGCATDSTFETSTSFIGKTTRNAGTGQAVKRRARIHDCRGTLKGVTKTGSADDVLGPFYFMQETVRMAENTYRFTFTDEDGNGKQVVMVAYVESVNIQNTINDFSVYDLNLIGTGGFEMDAISPPEAVDEEIFSDHWNTTEGETAIDGLSAVKSYSLLAADIEILEVDREGIQYDIITTGSPGNRQCLYDSGAGSIIFEQGFYPGETVFVLFKVVG